MKGDAVFSAERLFGITGTHLRDPAFPQNGYDDWTALSFGSRGSSYQAPFDVPRFAFDYLVIEHLSIGGALGYASVNPDRQVDASEFLLAPRVGYLYSFGRVVAIWPRGGITYHSMNVDDDRDNFGDSDGLALTMECPFTFAPTPHFAFMVGPTFDIDMFGTRHTPINEVTHKFRTFGLNAGLVGWL